MVKWIRGFFLLGLFIPFSLQSQVLKGELGLNYFFDNTEFSSSTLTIDQTMKGVHLIPGVAVEWDKNNSLHGGTDLLNISGSQKTIEKIDLVAYYQFQSRKTLFRAGSFPRQNILSNYSDFFFKDSIRYFRPNLQGLFWQVSNPTSFFNLWLDWTGHQTATQRESFFIGASANKRQHLFFADFQSYMFHYANTAPRNPEYHVCDNLLAHLSAGVDLTSLTQLDTLMFAVGILQGFERERGMDNMTFTPTGLVVRNEIEYRKFGVSNTLYWGDARMKLYEKHGWNLYWSNPFLRSGSYFESKWYWNMLKNSYVNGKLAMEFHVSEGKVFFEQLFTLSASVDKLLKK